MTPVWKKVAGVGFLLVAGSFFSGSKGVVIGVTGGVVVAIANLWLLEHLIRELIKRQTGGKEPKKARLVLLLFFKFVVIFGVIGFLALKTQVRMGPFLVGFSCIVIGIVLEGMTNLLTSR